MMSAYRRVSGGRLQDHRPTAKLHPAATGRATSRPNLSCTPTASIMTNAATAMPTAIGLFIFRKRRGLLLCSTGYTGWPSSVPAVSACARRRR
jgi:hypothetical protein